MRRVFRLGFGAHIEREVDDELAFHIEMRTERLIAAGLTPEAARAEALRQFGDVDGVRKYCVVMDHERKRAMDRSNLLLELRQDLLYALRLLRRNPGFTAVVVLTLALGIGANTAIFTLVDAVLLRPLPVRAPEELIAIGDPARTSSLSLGSPVADVISYPLYRDLRDRNRLVTGLLASGRTGRLDVRMRTDSASTPDIEHPRGRFVSGNYFNVLGVLAQVGRTFDGREDAAPGVAPIAVISDAYWTRRFARDRGVVGRTLVVNRAALTIVGIAPPGFAGEIVGQATELWIPITMQPVLMPNQHFLQDRNASWLLLLGRLAPGVTLAGAKAEFTVLIRESLVAAAEGASHAAQFRTEEVFVSSGAKGFSRLRKTYGTALLTLMTGVGLVLLIICANVANLLLARGVARDREIAVRLAIGAGRFRLVRQLLTESLVLALSSAAVGLVVAWFGSKLLLALVADGASPIPLTVRLDRPVLGYTLVLSVVAVAVFGLVPALRSAGLDLATTMRAGARGVAGSVRNASGRRIPIGALTIVGQVALSLVLLGGGALLVRSLRNVQNADPGLDRDHLLIVDVDAVGRGYSGERRVALARELTGRFARIPGVAAVSYSENGIFSGTESSSRLHVPGFTPRAADDTTANYDQVGPGYVRAIGARLLRGRDIGDGDDARAAPVALINETMARFYFPGASPVGRTLVFKDTVSVQIIGVVGDVKDHDLRDPPGRRFYVSYQQRAQGEPDAIRFVVRATGDPAPLAPLVRREITAADASLPILHVDPLRILMRDSVREERLLARLAVGFGVLALLIAAIGLYGVMMYAVRRRTSEIGLRVALGALPADVVRMVLSDALRVVLVGIVVGVPLMFVSTRLLRSQLHGVGHTDPTAFVVAVGLLVGTAFVAALLPALRAARVAPLVALREE
jgi:putative ABC transport system permease protein